MKIGDYVRTKDGIIGKLQQKDYTHDKEWIIDTLWYDFDEIVDKWTCGVMEWNIIKSTPNILDLIEPQDLMYIDIDNDYTGGIVVPRVAETMRELEEYINRFKNKEITLVGIVTHEQLDNCKYEVVE